jgi:hypothetical protein
MEVMERLEEENRQLKLALSFLMNKSLVRELSDALNRINNGEYITEEEFFSDSPLKSA